MLIDGLAQWVPDDGERIEEQTVGGLLRWAAREAPDEVALVAGVPDPAASRWRTRSAACARTCRTCARSCSSASGTGSGPAGEQVAAVVRLRDPAGAPVGDDELAGFCRERLARHKVPKLWHRSDALPLTGSGKVMKHVLREQLAQEPGATGGPAG